MSVQTGQDRPDNTKPDTCQKQQYAEGIRPEVRAIFDDILKRHAKAWKKLANS